MVTTEPGGGTDLVARAVAQGITGPLGQPVIVENRGGNQIIGIDLVIKAPPDGYTLLLSGSSVWLLPYLQDNVPYDPLRDFAPVTLAATSPNILVVHPSVPVNSVRELIALARARPGELNYGTGIAGSANHLAAELFRAMTGIDIVRISYKGAAPALNDLIAGQVQMMVATAPSASPHVRSGRLKGLAVTTAQPSALAPGLPTVAAAGVPGYESGSTLGIWAPARTPAAVIQRLNQEVERFLGRADVKERFLNIGLEPAPSSPEQFTAVMKSEMARMGKVIRDAGIRAD